MFELNQIARTELSEDILISTIKLPATFYDDTIYETMIFGLFDDEYQRRCGGIEKAKKQHQKAVQKAKKAL